MAEQKNPNSPKHSGIRKSTPEGKKKNQQTIQLPEKKLLIQEYISSLN